MGQSLDDSFATDVFDEAQALLGNLDGHSMDESFKTVVNNAGD